MATSQRQQAERNIVKHKNYIKFIKKYYKEHELGIFSVEISPSRIFKKEESLVDMLRELIKIERKKAKK